PKPFPPSHAVVALPQPPPTVPSTLSLHDALPISFFRRTEAGVDEGLRQIQFAAGPQVFCEGVQESRQGPVALPLLEAAMASLIGRIAVGQIVPGSAGAQHPKTPVEHGAGILPWSPSLPNWFRVKERLQNRPLGVGEVHVAISTQARSSTISIWP